MNLTYEQINEVADVLRGTCLLSYEDALEEVLGERPVNYWDVMTLDDCKELDELVFNCTTCGWWCGTEDLAPSEYDQICNQCYEEEND